VLVCPATEYGIKYSINPWMALDNQADHARAVRQWTRLTEMIGSLGYETCSIRCEEKGEWPDIVFTANAGLVLGNTVVLSNFRHRERQGEKAFYRRWFLEQGYDVQELPGDVYFEGAGDALFAGKLLVGGYGLRTDSAAYSYLKECLDLGEVLLCRTVSPSFYHLDTCFCPLNERQALIHPGAFEEESVAALGRRLHLIEVPEDEARKFACNAVVLGKNVIIPAGCPVTRSRLERRGYAVHSCDMSEFLKAGGACKCLTLLV
jgi:N-dimethylarginine dimethylaminohydrolase